MPYTAGHVATRWSATSGSIAPSYYNLGSTRNGVIERVTNHEQNVVDDAYGDATPDAIQQGTDTTVQLTWIEYGKMRLASADGNGGPNAALPAATAFANSPLSAQTPAGKINDNVGKRLSSLAGVLIITPIAGTPAETDMGVGNSKIYYLAIPITDIETPYSSKLREGPMTFRCLPDATRGNKVWDIITTPSFPNG